MTDDAISLEHPDITYVRLTGYPKGMAVPTPSYPRGATVDDNAFPFEPDEREDD